MRVRCGSCRTEFEVPGAGRFACPVCGSVNAVREANGEDAAPSGMGGYQTAPGVGGAGAPPPPPPPPPPPEPDAPMPKIACPECGFTFIIGQVSTVTCPNCSTEIDTGIEEENGE